MTTKTIPAYLEEERQKDKDAHLRMEEEAARIMLHHGHHRAGKQAKPELPTPITADFKSRKPGATTGKKTPVTKRLRRKLARGRDSVAAVARR
jgi:hypothetical protein